MSEPDFDPEKPAHRIRPRLGGDRAKTERRLDQAISRLLAVLPADGGKSLSADGPVRVTEWLDDLAHLLHRETYYAAAERLTRRAQAVMDKAGVIDAESAAQRHLLILDGQLKRGAIDDAARTLSALDSMEPALRGRQHDSLVARLHGAITRVEPAELDGRTLARLYDMLVAVQARDLGDDHPDTLLARIRQARIHFLSGRLDQARDAYDRLIPRLWPDLETRYRPVYWARREVFRNQGVIALRQGRLEQAEAFLALADDFNDRYGLAETDAGHPHVAIIPGIDLARLHARQGDVDRAEALLVHFLEDDDAGARPSDRRIQLAALVRLLLDQDRRADAEAAFARFAPRPEAERGPLQRELLGSP